MEVFFENVIRKPAVPDEDRFERIFAVALRIFEVDCEARAIGSGSLRAGTDPADAWRTGRRPALERPDRRAGAQRAFRVFDEFRPGSEAQKQTIGFLTAKGLQEFIRRDHKPRSGRMGDAGSEQVSKFLADVWGTGNIELGAEVKDIKALNAWLRGNGVEVGGGYRVGDELHFDDGTEIVLEIP